MANDLKKETERLLSIDMPPHIRIIFGDHERHIRDLQAEVDRLHKQREEPFGVLIRKHGDPWSFVPWDDWVMWADSVYEDEHVIVFKLK